MEKQNATQVPKIAITSLSEECLSAALEKVNTGFLGGKVSKLDLASFALIDSLENLNESKIEKIRKRFFNEISYLEAIVRMNKANGQERLTQEQLSVLQNLLGTKPEKAKKIKDEGLGIASID